MQNQFFVVCWFSRAQRNVITALKVHTGSYVVVIFTAKIGRTVCITRFLTDCEFLHVFFLFLFKASALWVDAFYKLKCPSVCLSVCVFTFEVLFKHLFATTSRSRMSYTFRDSKSLGKSNGKKWSQI